ncbi:MAG: DUF1848 domain-containing protein [Ignavibacteriaceae bacterium]
MIISASRRTDIPAFYSEWFINRIEEGYCTVPNPLFKNQISVISLHPADVDVFVFWTRNPKPLFPHIDYLNELGYKYYFQFTINNYPKHYEPNNPSIDSSIKNFNYISDKLGTGKIIWRYDPILLTKDLTADFHLKNFTFISNMLRGKTHRVVISIVDDYKKTLRHLNKINVDYQPNQTENREYEYLLKSIVGISTSNGMKVESCAEAKNYAYLGIEHGKCIDDQLILKEFGIDLKYKKDKTQRPACGCIDSRDIGANDSCLMGCVYCYATFEHENAIQNFKSHDPKFPALIKHSFSEELLIKIKNIQNKNNQGSLF